MLARLGVLLRLAFPVELALAFTAAIFLLGFVTAMSAAPASSSARTQQTAAALATASPTMAAGGTSGSTVTGETVAPATAATVTMGAQGASFVFAPATLTIRVGTTITWKNTSTVPHTVVGSGFDSGVLMAGQSFTHTFTQAGTFAYTCTIHPGMAATIRVVP